jgi:hypothetical protein
VEAVNNKAFAFVEAKERVAVLVPNFASMNKDCNSRIVEVVNTGQTHSQEVLIEELAVEDLVPIHRNSDHIVRMPHWQKRSN